MLKPAIPLGLVFSRSGPYEMMAREMEKSALMAVDEVNCSDEFDFTFTPHLRDPGGVVAAYHTACDDLIRSEQVHHIVGCYTSASRKQVIPIVERTERLLWHPARYEGFEASDNVIYVGAAPNHTVVPLVRHMLENISTDVFSARRRSTISSGKSSTAGPPSSSTLWSANPATSSCARCTPPRSMQGSRSRS